MKMFRMEAPQSLIGVCLLTELYDIFLSRAKEKWRSYSETSSVNDSESGMTVSRHHGQTKVTPDPERVVCVVEATSVADRESSLDLIKLDISRTFPSLFIFQKVRRLHLASSSSSLR